MVQMKHKMAIQGYSR